MALQTTVKVGNITNLSDARYCAGMGVELLGFSIDEASSQYVDLKKYQEIRAWVAGVQIVAETREDNTENLLEKLRAHAPDAVQVSRASWLPWLKSELDKPLILSIEASQDADTIADLMHKNAPYVQYFLLESTTTTGGMALDGDWPDFLADLAQKYPILLGFGVEASSIVALTQVIQLAGVALNGSTEIRPGYSEFGNLMDVLEALEED